MEEEKIFRFCTSCFVVLNGKATSLMNDLSNLRNAFAHPFQITSQEEKPWGLLQTL